jgi:hypothetical protein
LFTLNLSLSLSKREGWLNVEDVTIHGFAMKVIDSFVSALRSISGVTWAFIANEGEWLELSVFVGLLHNDTTLDVTVLAEDLLELIGSV